jgi:ATP-binding cassette subfamily B protein
MEAKEQPPKPETGFDPKPDPGAKPTRILWSYMRPHRRKLALGVLLSLAVTGSSLAGPLVTKTVLDRLAADQSIVGPVVLLGALLVAGSVLGLWQWIMLGTLGERVVLDARGTMVRRLFRVRIPELTGRSSGEFVTRVTSDTVMLREAAAGSLVQLVNGVVGLFGALALMAVLDTVLLATTVGTLLVVAALAGVLMPKMAKAQREAQAAVGRVGSALEGAMRAIRTVKASRAEERETERVLVEARESARHSIRSVRMEAIAWTITWGGISLAVMLVLAIGAYRVDQGALAVSGLVAFLLYLFQLMGPASELTQTFTQLQSGIAAAARISEIEALGVEESEPTAHPEPGTVAAPTPAVLSFSEVTARYAPGTAPALNGVSLDIARTGHTAIVGPSGAGKTTAFSLMLRFLHPEHGEISLDGLPLQHWSLEALRQRIAYVEQDTPLVPGTLAENLRYTHPEATDEELWAALATVQLDDRARELPEGLDTLLTGAAISGGERQRIALARALVSRPEILLLDEATAQLDGLTEAAVQVAIRELAHRGAVVTIAHRLSTVIDADRIVLLEAGRTRAVGTHAELLEADELYRDLVSALRIATATTPEPEPGTEPDAGTPERQLEPSAG